jgi:hypothetical protein
MTSQFTKEKSTYTLQSKGHDKSKARTQGGASKQDHQNRRARESFPSQNPTEAIEKSERMN